MSSHLPRTITSAGTKLLMNTAALARMSAGSIIANQVRALTALVATADANPLGAVNDCELSA